MHAAANAILQVQKVGNPIGNISLFLLRASFLLLLLLPAAIFLLLCFWVRAFGVPLLLFAVPLRAACLLV